MKRVGYIKGHRCESDMKLKVIMINQNHLKLRKQSL